MLTSEEKCELLGIARDVIGSVLQNRPSSRQMLASEMLQKPQGAFVTIRVDGRLRGCIGYIESEKPLVQVVAEVAEKAAFEDPRFPPLSLAEYEHSRIEISVLTELKPVADPEEIQVGLHGLLLETGTHKGLLLPQVAVEYGWDRYAFLDAVARKAGLTKFNKEDPELRLYVFGAEVIEEEEAVSHG